MMEYKISSDPYMQKSDDYPLICPWSPNHYWVIQVHCKYRWICTVLPAKSDSDVMFCVMLQKFKVLQQALKIPYTGMP